MWSSGRATARILLSPTSPQPENHKKAPIFMQSLKKVLSFWKKNITKIFKFQKEV